MIAPSMSEARATCLPAVPLHDLRAVWFQLAGTLCNLSCRHCFNSSGPRDPWLAPLESAVVRAHLEEAESLGVREIYFTGGEPLLHPDILPLLEAALAVAPTTVLTNGTLIDDGLADRLAILAAGSAYSLEIRLSVDGATAEEHDAIRGRGTFGRVLAAARRLSLRGLHPIVTAVEGLDRTPRAEPLYGRLRATLRAAGVERPRIKILPVLPLGRCDGGESRRLSPADLDGVDTDRLECAQARVVAAGGIYACPILAGLAVARVGTARLTDALGPVTLAHRACVTCHETALTCRNA